MSLKSILITIIIASLIVIILIAPLLISSDEAELQQETERYNGTLEYVYGEPNATYGVHTYLLYDPISEVCYYQEKAIYSKRLYNSIVELYYGDRLLHYCPHNINSENTVGTFYILVNDEPIKVDPTITTCPFNN